MPVPKEAVSIPIAAYFIDRRRRHNNKTEKLIDPRNLSDSPDFQTHGYSDSANIRGSAPLFSESRASSLSEHPGTRTSKEKKKRPQVFRFGLKKKVLVGGGLGVAGLAVGGRLSRESREENPYARYPYYRHQEDFASNRLTQIGLAKRKRKFLNKFIRDLVTRRRKAPRKNKGARKGIEELNIQRNSATKELENLRSPRPNIIMPKLGKKALLSSKERADFFKNYLRRFPTKTNMDYPLEGNLRLPLPKIGAPMSKREIMRLLKNSSFENFASGYDHIL